MWKKIKSYVFSVAIALGVGGLSAFLTKDKIEVYKNLNQPPLTPPPAVFPVVWSILFILMGIGSAIVYKKRDADRDNAGSALKIYGLQLVVNFFWSIIFFNMQSYLFAFIWLILLLVLIVITIVEFHKISPIAAYLQIPYLVWVMFAGYLNLMIFILNR